MFSVFKVETQTFFKIKVWMATMQFHCFISDIICLISSQGLPISHFYPVFQAVTYLSTFVFHLILVWQHISDLSIPSLCKNLSLVFCNVTCILDLIWCVWFLSTINRYVWVTDAMVDIIIQTDYVPCFHFFR